MKFFVSSLFLSCSLFSYTSYASPHTSDEITKELPSPSASCRNSFEDAESYKGQAEEFKSPQPRKGRKQEADSLDDNTQLIPLPTSNKKGRTLPLTFESFLSGSLFPALREVVLSELSFKDQAHLGGTCRKAHRLYLNQCLEEDPRGLQNKTWVGGPQKGSTELYRFNAAIFCGLKHLLIANHFKKSTHHIVPHETLSQLKPVSKVVSYLKSHFQRSHPEVTRTATEFFSSAYVSLNRGVPFTISALLETLAGSPENLGERDLMQHYLYLTSTAPEAYDPFYCFYSNNPKNPDEMNVVTRLALCKSMESNLQGAIDLQNDADDWELIAQFGIIVKADSLRISAKASEYKDNWIAATKTWERFFKEFPNEVEPRDLRSAAHAYWFSNNPKRALDLLLRLFQEFPQDERIEDLRMAIEASRSMGNEDLSIDLSETLLHSYPDQVNGTDLKYAAAAHMYVENYERAHELWLECLDEFPRMLTQDDLRQAAEACHYFGDAAREFDIRKELNLNIVPQLIKEAVSQNLYRLRDYKKAAAIAEMLFEHHPSEVCVDFLILAADANEKAGKYKRTLELWEKFINDYPKNVDEGILRNAIEFNIQYGSPERSVELSERLIKDFPEKVIARDLWMAINAKVELENVDRAEFLLKQLFKDFPRDVQAVHLRLAAGISYEIHKDHDRTLQYLNRLFKEFSNEVSDDDLWLAALAHEQAGKSEDVIQLLERLFKDFPKNVTAERLRLAIKANDQAGDNEKVAQLSEMLFDKLKEKEITAEDLRIALKANEHIGKEEVVLGMRGHLFHAFPSHLTVEDLRALIEANDRPGNEQKTLEITEKLLQDFPDEATADEFYLAGRIHFVDKNFDKSLQYYQEAYKKTQKYALDLFTILHMDREKYKGEIDEMLQDDVLSSEEKEIYSSLIKGTEREIHQRIHRYIEHPSYTSSWSDQFRDFVVHIGFIIS